MEPPNSNSWWFGFGSVALFIIVLSTTKISRARSAIHRSGRTTQLPPLVGGIALLKLLPALLKNGLPAVVNDLYVKHGSVFMASFFGQKVTFLVGPEVSAHFFQGLDSEISQGNLYEFTVPMFGKEVAFGRDRDTRSEQLRFQLEAIKPSRLSIHVSLMLQEVEVSSTHIHLDNYLHICSRVLSN
jgi:sterol 14-demethylase